jgi:alcohol dehydrogenase class IV
MDFNFYFPTRFLFGVEKFELLGEEAARLGKRALLVTYPSQSLAGWVARAQEQLAAHGVESVLFPEATSNPTVAIVDKAAALARQAGCDLAIGLGGGSAMDVAKLAAAACSAQTGIWQVFEGAPIPDPGMPVIAVPTTAGAGSEATYYAVVSHPELQRKEGFARRQFFPTVSILDPRLTLTLPPLMTAATGLDVVTHAIEAYTSKLASPLSDLYAAEAIRLAGKYLRRATYHGQDMEARHGMMYASALAGVAITHADTCLAHVIGEAVGAVFATGHALSVALVLPAVMEYNCVANPEKYASITQLLGEGEYTSLREAARRAAGVVRELIYDLPVPRGLAALGVSSHAQITALVNRPGMDASNARPAGAEDYTQLLTASLSPAMSYWQVRGEHE